MRAVVCDRLGDPSVLQDQGRADPRDRPRRRADQGRRRLGQLPRRADAVGRLPAQARAAVHSRHGRRRHDLGRRRRREELAGGRSRDLRRAARRLRRVCEGAGLGQPDAPAGGLVGCRRLGFPRRCHHRLPFAGPSRGAEAARGPAGAWRLGRRRHGRRPARQASRRAGDRHRQRRCAARRGARAGGRPGGEPDAQPTSCRS